MSELPPVAIVTGVAGDLGRAIASALAASGWRVVGTDVVKVDLGAPDEEFVRADIASPSSVSELFTYVEQRYGRLNGLVNNASIYRGLSPKGAFGDISLDEFDLVMRINVRGTWQMMAAAVPLLTRSGGGSIVNVSSASHRGGTVGFPHYAASKAAVEALTRVGARELGERSIRVNAVAPGLLTTSATLDRVNESERSIAASRRSIPRDLNTADVVGSVQFLLGELSGFITGQTVIVDGGELFG